MGHPLRTGCPLGHAVLPQRSLDRGCDPRCFADARAPSLKRFGRPLTHACGCALPGGRRSTCHLLRVSAQTPSPHVGAGMTEAWTWSRWNEPCRAAGRRHRTTASWPLTRPWSLEGGATTLWPRTTCRAPPLTESVMPVQAFAATQRAQQLPQAQGSWILMARRTQLLPPPRNPPKCQRGAQ
jgi:hypothetical protein